MVILPDQKVCSGQKTKVEKQEPLKFGPINATFKIGWDMLLIKVTELLAISVDCLVVSLMEWHFLKPQNSLWLSISNKNVMQSMLRQAAVKFKKDASGYLMLQMQQPLSSKMPQLPWSESPSTVGMAKLAPDNDKSSDGDTSTQNSKKVRLDDDLQSQALELKSMYPPGRCAMHPDVACFYHQGTDSHFLLDKLACLVWAYAIQNKKATKEKPPLGSNFFKPQNALKSKASLSFKIDARSMAAASPPTPAGIPPFPVQYPPSLNPFFLYGMGMSMPLPTFFAPPNPYSMGSLGNVALPWGANQSVVPGPSHTSTQREIMQSSSLLMPDGNIHKFCKQYNLSKDVEGGLEKLEFQIGDNIDNLPKDVYQAVGFTYLSWQRVLKAYGKFKRHTKLS